MLKSIVSQSCQDLAIQAHIPGFGKLLISSPTARGTESHEGAIREVEEQKIKVNASRLVLKGVSEGINWRNDSRGMTDFRRFQSPAPDCAEEQLEQ